MVRLLVAGGTCGFSYREDQVVPLRDCCCSSFQIQKMKLILFCRVPASSRRQNTSMILQIAPHTDQILVLGGIVVPIANVGCQKKCPTMVKVG